MNWYIGQDIVCVKSHTKGTVKKGIVYTIRGLQLGACGCGVVEIDVGVPKATEDARCGICSSRHINHSNCWWIAECLFAPLDSFVNSEEIAELLEETGVIQQ